MIGATREGVVLPFSLRRQAAKSPGSMVKILVLDSRVARSASAAPAKSSGRSHNATSGMGCRQFSVPGGGQAQGFPTGRESSTGCEGVLAAGLELTRFDGKLKSLLSVRETNKERFECFLRMW